MIKEEIIQMDWKSLLLGNTSTSFLLETAIRAVLVLFALFAVIRLARQRADSPLNTPKLVTSVAISAVLGSIVFVPTLGIVPVTGILIVLLVFQYLIVATGTRKKTRSAADNTPGSVVTVVEDGRLKFETMKRRRLLLEDLYAFLRTQGVEHLGQVRRVYWETNGQFSVFCTPQAKPGLSILPDTEKEFLQESVVPEHFACADCGNVMISEATPMTRCPRCGQLSWVEAVQAYSKQPEKPVYQRELF